jgi:hypothetical protein
MAVNFDSKLKDIMACPEAVAILEEMTPGISKNPVLKTIYAAPLSAAVKMPGSGFTPEKIEILKAKINALNA